MTNENLLCNMGSSVSAGDLNGKGTQKRGRMQKAKCWREEALRLGKGDPRTGGQVWGRQEGTP